MFPHPGISHVNRVCLTSLTYQIRISIGCSPARPNPCTWSLNRFFASRGARLENCRSLGRVSACRILGHTDDALVVARCIEVICPRVNYTFMAAVFSCPFVAELLVGFGKDVANGDLTARHANVVFSRILCFSTSHMICYQFDAGSLEFLLLQHRFQSKHPHYTDHIEGRIFERGIVFLLDIQDQYLAGTDYRAHIE